MSTVDLINPVLAKTERSIPPIMIVMRIPIDPDAAQRRQGFQSLGSRWLGPLSIPYSRSHAHRIMIIPQFLLPHPKLDTPRLGKRLFPRIPHAPRGMRTSIGARLKRLGAARPGVLEDGCDFSKRFLDVFPCISAYPAEL